MASAWEFVPRFQRFCGRVIEGTYCGWDNGYNAWEDDEGAKW